MAQRRTKRADGRYSVTARLESTDGIKRRVYFYGRTQAEATADGAEVSTSTNRSGPDRSSTAVGRRSWRPRKSLQLKSPPSPSRGWFDGIRAATQFAKASGLRDCSKTRPGPVKSKTQRAAP